MGGRGGYSYSTYKAWKEMKTEVWSLAPWEYKTLKQFAEGLEQKDAEYRKQDQYDNIVDWTGTTNYVQTIRHAQSGKDTGTAIYDKQEALRRANLIEDAIEQVSKEDQIVFKNGKAVRHYEGELYRGLKIPQETWDKTIKVGNEIGMEGLSSWSKSEFTAISFAENGHLSFMGKKTVFRVMNGSGMDVDDVSVYGGAGGEREVIISSKARFQILSIDEPYMGTEDDIRTVYLRQIN